MARQTATPSGSSRGTPRARPVMALSWPSSRARRLETTLSSHDVSQYRRPACGVAAPSPTRRLNVCGRLRRPMSQLGARFYLLELLFAPVCCESGRDTNSWLAYAPRLLTPCAALKQEQQITGRRIDARRAPLTPLSGTRYGARVTCISFTLTPCCRIAPSPRSLSLLYTIHSSLIPGAGPRAVLNYPSCM
jgi:hypothetical protein